MCVKAEQTLKKAYSALAHSSSMKFKQITMNLLRLLKFCMGISFKDAVWYDIFVLYLSSIIRSKRSTILILYRPAK